MHRRNVGLATLGVAAVGLVAAVNFPAAAATSPAPAPLAPAAGAAPAGTAPAASDEVFAALQRDLRLTPQQARTRLAGESRAIRAEARLRGELGPRFAGSWLDSDGGRLVVAVTDDASAKLVSTAGAQPKVVTRGAAQLERTKNQLDQAAAKAPQAVTGWYVDEADNTVVVTARSAQAAKAFAASGGVGARDVRIIESAEAPRLLHDVRGGDAFFMGGGRCSVGFSVAGGFVTAGHCGKTGTATRGFNQVTQGSFAGSSFPGDDYAFVKVNGGWTPQPFVNDARGGNVIVAGGQEAPVGTSICRSGSTTGWHCGTVQAKNATVNYPQGRVMGLTRTNVCAEPGDSGGAWISGDQAQGVTSGGSGDCTRGGTTFFQPLDEILSAYNLTLVTRAGGGTPTSPPSATPPPATTPPPTTPPSATPPPVTPPAAGTWRANTVYRYGTQVTHAGVRYVCRISHRARPGWEPPNAPALWRRV
ncbi:MAG TPA: alpha-lytic protease prodomain-containing protein [Catenuloplanes sp.]